MSEDPDDPRHAPPALSDAKLSFASRGFGSNVSRGNVGGSFKSFMEESFDFGEEGLPANSFSNAGALHTGRDEVILNLECESEAETKWIIFMLRLTVMLAVAALAAQLHLKLDKDQSDWFDKRQFAILGVAASGACLVVLSAVLLVSCRRLWLVRHRHWSQRRLRLFMFHFLELIFEIINVIFWLIPNAAVLSSECYLFSALVDASAAIRWSCWNCIFFLLATMAHCTVPLREGGRRRKALGAAFPDTIGTLVILDAPLWVHWPQALVWLTLEAGLICQQFDTPRMELNDAVDLQGCSDMVYFCHHNAHFDNTELVSKALVGIALGLYALIMLVHAVRTFRHLQKAPYSTFRVGNIVARLQLRTSCVSIIIFLTSTPALAIVKRNRCSSYIDTWFGLLPNQLVMTGLGAAGVLFFAPRASDTESARVKVMLQDICWTEDARPQKLRERKAAVSHTDSIAAEPLFCMETCLKGFHWTFLSYRYSEQPGTDVAKQDTQDQEVLQGPVDMDPRVENALQLFGLTNIELFREKTHDTKMLLGSGPDTIVLSFRGTASYASALADLQAWQVRHPLRPRGRLRWPVMVHSGFLRCWTAGGLRDRVLERVGELLRQGSVPASEMRILLTGHSLGGALASLVAYDIAKLFGDRQIRLECYTFGSPRVGNGAFKRDFNRLVPDTWQIICDQDAIVRAARFWGIYRRSGQRVIINNQGDLAIRPLSLEQRLHIRLPGGSLANHMLAAYKEAIVAVLESQFTSKRIPGGPAGVTSLVNSSTAARNILESAGFVLEEVTPEQRSAALANMESGVVLPRLASLRRSF